MKAHAIDHRAPSSGDEGGLLGVDELTDAKHAEPGTITHRYATADRGGVEICEQRLFLGQRIGSRSIGIGGETAADEKIAQPADDASGGLFDLGIGGRRQATEAGGVTSRLLVDAVEDNRVKVQVQIECVAKALDER